MPEINAPSGLDSNWDLRNWILSVMEFPTDTPSRETARAIRQVEYALAVSPAESRLPVPREALHLIVSAAKSTGMKAPVADATKRGCVAGDLLVTLYTLSAFPEHFDKPSMNQAVFVASCFGRTTTQDTVSAPYSKSEIPKCFAQFRTVAHLWGAYRINMSLPFRSDGDWLTHPESFISFMGVAATLQDFGCRFCLPGKTESVRKPLLEGQACQRVPLFIGLHICRSIHRSQQQQRTIRFLKYSASLHIPRILFRKLIFKSPLRIQLPKANGK